jgi:hypothetical protein
MPRPGYGPVQLRERLGWREWQFERARAENLVPPPNMVVSVGPGRGTGRRWSDDVVAGLAARVGALTAQLGRVPGRRGGAGRGDPGRAARGARRAPRRGGPVAGRA